MLMARMKLGIAFSVVLWTAPVWAAPMTGCSAAPGQVDLWCEQHVCDADPLAWTTDNDHVEGLAVALDNINAASGLRLRIDSAGSPVRFMPVVLGKKGGPVCGSTIVMTRSGVIGSTDVEVATELEGCPAHWATIRHEVMCHALRGTLHGEHTETGVCSPLGSDEARIDKLSLDAMCSEMAC